MLDLIRLVDNTANKATKYRVQGRTHLYEYEGEWLPLNDICKALDIHYQSLYRYLQRGKTMAEIKKAIKSGKIRKASEVRERNKLKHVLSVNELVKRTGKTRTTIRYYRFHGMTDDQILDGGTPGPRMKVIEGRNYTMQELSSITGVSSTILSESDLKGLTIDQIKEKLPRDSRLYFYNGEYQRMTTIAKAKGISPSTVRSRVKKGMTVKDALKLDALS